MTSFKARVGRKFKIVAAALNYEDTVDLMLKGNRIFLADKIDITDDLPNFPVEDMAKNKQGYDGWASAEINIYFSAEPYYRGDGSGGESPQGHDFEIEDATVTYKGKHYPLKKLLKKSGGEKELEDAFSDSLNDVWEASEEEPDL